MILGALSYTGNFSKAQDIHLHKLINHIRWENAQTTSLSYKSLEVQILKDTHLPPNSSQYIDEVNDRVVIVHGNVYNPDTLDATSELLAEKIAFHYASSDFSLLSELNGAFSICIFDLQKNTHYLIKDQIGIVPLSFAIIDDTLFFSSDTMGMTKALFGDEKIDHDYIVSTFYHFEENFAFTPNKHVVKVTPGHYAEISGSNYTQKKYWFPEQIKPEKRDRKQAITELEALVRDSIQTRSDQRYTAGAHLSGGLDSSLVAAIGRSFYPKQDSFVGYTWSPDQVIDGDKLRFDERDLIRQQCAKSDIQISYSNFTKEDYHAHLRDWRAPSESVFERNIVSAAQKDGVNLIFSGWGGDEFISMGKPYVEYDLFWSGQWGKYLKIHPLKRKRAFLKSIVANVFLPRQMIPYLIYKTAPFMHKYMKKGMPSNKLNRLQRSTYTKRRGIHIGLLEYKHLAQRCEDWYINGQRNGIEYRYPLLDKRIVEYVLTLPTSFFVRGELDRSLIREVGEKWLVDDIKELPQKADPALGHVFNGILQEANMEYTKEIDDFRENAYLWFFDFDMLEEDIQHSIDTENKLSLEMILVIPYVKMIHEFTKSFHSKK